MPSIPHNVWRLAKCLVSVLINALTPVDEIVGDGVNADTTARESRGKLDLDDQRNISRRHHPRHNMRCTQSRSA